ncbi:murein transglycosylase A [Stenotrophomonas rhizophila]|uniref:murein transglycosylase A n=1 Tax=Stenotrophomonas rhizophila TaxID=216778 RepID=UPI001E4EE351|nr:MltA domain-containing protein [Stenotrophomonas rhizophila]MCC7633193.1 MltA domain-containing protein [Stenotrophomonas rhizophila]MCC7662086.1 MltA domain-containing protein [Stenotrophomonas rhizophila]
MKATRPTVVCKRSALVLLALALLSGCAVQNHRPDAPANPYLKADWKALPAVTDADLQAGFAAWRSACPRLKTDPNWAPTCSAAANVATTPDAIRQFLQNSLDVYALRAGGNRADGLITGYYEPIYPGSLTRTAKATVPVYGVPGDMVSVQLDSLYPELKGKRLRGRVDGRVLRPYDDAATIAARGVKAPVLAWLTHPMDLQFLQIQGSGRIALADGRHLRIAYADQNGHPYRPIGRWLVAQGELKKEDVTMDAIRAWANAHPARIPELLASNPSYVFFAKGPDGDEGPRGSLNVPLTAGYSVAVDRTVVPLGSLLWLSTTRPDGTPVVRPVAAQDTGGAIAGEVRADLFWGTGDAAGKLAGDMKQKGNIWMLWPKGVALPKAPDKSE